MRWNADVEQLLKEAEEELLKMEEKRKIAGDDNRVAAEAAKRASRDTEVSPILESNHKKKSTPGGIGISEDTYWAGYSEKEGGNRNEDNQRPFQEMD